jgi:hypothetical protein
MRSAVSYINQNIFIESYSFFKNPARIAKKFVGMQFYFLTGLSSVAVYVIVCLPFLAAAAAVVIQ